MGSQERLVLLSSWHDRDREESAEALLTLNPGEDNKMAESVLGVTVTIQFSSILALLVTVVFIVVMSVVSTRLLGVRPRRWRSIIAAILGWVVGVAAAVPIARHRSRDEFYALAVLFGVLATMLLHVILEAIARPALSHPKPRRRRAFLHPMRWLKTTMSPIGRFREVLRYARRHGLVRFEYVSAEGITTAEFGNRLRLTLEDAGGMFVKFGQIASTRGDLLAEPVIAELSQLRASVRPIPGEDLRSLVETELDRSVEDAFGSFDWEPLAAASIGQTHRATLRDGSRVVVKIQRPRMDDLLRRDATVLRLAASLAERRSEGARRLGVRQLAEELILGMERELDYEREAYMSRRLGGELEVDGGVGVPGVHDSLSTSRLLVMDEVEGRSVDDQAAVIESGVDADELARRLLRSFLSQILRGGAYHADPHPGNVFVSRSGDLWLLDFGAVGLLDPVSREALQEIALGMSINDPLLVARSVRRLTGADSTVDLRPLEADIGMLMVETGSGGRFDPKIVQDILTLLGTYGLHVPRAMTQLSRTLLTLDGTLRIVAPWFDLATEATAMVDQLTSARPAPGEDVFQSEVLRALPILRTLPEHVDELATQLRAGRMSVRVSRYAAEDRAVVDGWIDRILLALIGSAGVIGAAILLLAASSTGSRDVSDTLRAVGFVGLVFGVVLIMRSVAQALYRSRPRSSA